MGFSKGNPFLRVWGKKTSRKKKGEKPRPKGKGERA